MILHLLQPDAEAPKVELLKARQPRIRIELPFGDCSKLDLTVKPECAFRLSLRLLRLASALRVAASGAAELAAPPPGDPS